MKYIRSILFVIVLILVSSSNGVSGQSITEPDTTLDIEKVRLMLGNIIAWKQDPPVIFNGVILQKYTLSWNPKYVAVITRDFNSDGELIAIFVNADSVCFSGRMIPIDGFPVMQYTDDSNCVRWNTMMSWIQPNDEERNKPLEDINNS